MSEPAGILFVTQHYSPELIGSAPFCVDIAEWLAGHERHVTVLTGPPHYPDPRNFADFRGNGADPEVTNGVTIRRIASLRPRRNSVIARLLGEFSFFFWGWLAILGRRVPRQKLILSLAPSIFAVALGSFARRKGGRHVAIVFDIQSGLARGLGMVGSGLLLRLMKWCERSVLNGTDLIVVLTESMRDELRALGVRASIEIISIWVDTTEFVPRIKSANILTENAPMTIGYSGNLGLKQGFHQIIALAEELSDRRPDIRIVLRGGGSQAQQLASEISKRNLHNVHLKALLPRDKFAGGLAEVDIHLVPLESGAAAFMLPSKIFNIMATGIPFVTTAEVGTALWWLRERSGGFLCVRPNAPEEFLNSILKLVENEALRVELGARGRRYVEENCSKERVLSNFIALLDRA